MGDVMKKKANRKGNQPKRHRYKREHRLANAWKIKDQLDSVKSRIKHYAKYYSINLKTAAIELRMLDYSLTEKEIQGMEQAIKAEELRQKRRLQKLEEENVDWDEGFSFIAGFTSGGAPYGTKRKEDLNNGD